MGVELPTECISSEETVVHGFLDDNSSDSGSEVVRLLNNRFLKYFQHKHLRYVRTCPYTCNDQHHI